MKTILVTGANGQLGNSIRRLAAGYPQYAFVFTDVDTLDICDAQAVNAFVKEKQVDYIINCAAYTAVDKAEDDEALCLRINRDAVRNLGEAARMAGARVIHVSTDYVFDGTNHLPYVETDNTCPASVYGRTKLAGEQALQEVCPDAVIIRTAWLYSEFGNNFVKTMLRLGNEREQLSVVFDQIGSPTYAGDLAAAIFAVLVQAEADAFVPGIYHYSNEGVCSWYDFAVKIMELGNAPCRVLPIESKDYPAKAARPHFSVLNKAKIKTIYKISISHWEASLRECMKRITKIGMWGITLMMLSACGNGTPDYDATGTFEATEVIVSAEAAGKLLRLEVEEGTKLEAGEEIGLVDTVQLYLKKLQLEASMKSVENQRPDLAKQIAATKQQIVTAERERKRVENLLAAGAANQKQLDDWDAQVKLLERQLVAQESSLRNSTNSLTEQGNSVAIQVAQVEDQLAKCHVQSPIAGIVLAKYAEAGELAAIGKPFF